MVAKKFIFRYKVWNRQTSLVLDRGLDGQIRLLLHAKLKAMFALFDEVAGLDLRAIQSSFMAINNHGLFSFEHRHI